MLYSILDPRFYTGDLYGKCGQHLRVVSDESVLGLESDLYIDNSHRIVIDADNDEALIQKNVDDIWQEDNFLQTKAWIDGDTWTDGDYCISSRKLHVCNTTGVQSGTFSSNAALWDELATLADTPHNILTSNDFYKNLLLTNSFLEYWDGTRQRIKITSTYSNLYSPDGGTLSIANAGLFYENNRVQTEAHKGVVNGIAELDALGIVPTSQLPGYVDAIVEYVSLVALVAADPQEANKIYITTDDNKMYRYTGTPGSYGEISPTIVLGTTNTTAYRGDRGLIAYDHSQLVQEHIDWTGATEHISTEGTISATGGGQTGKFQTGGAGATVFSFTGGSFNVRAGSGTSSTQNTLSITNTGAFSFDDLTRIRLAGDATSTYMVSPDGTKNLTLTDTDLKVTDAGGDRFIISDTGLGLFSPDGLHSIVVANVGATYDTVEIATVTDLHAEYTHPTGDGNLHVPANSTTNDGKVLTAGAVAGTYTWKTFDGAGHDSDKIISPDTLKSLTVYNSNLLYSDGSYPRLYIDGTESRLTSPDGQSLLQVKDADFNFDDGTRDRIEADGIGTTLRSTTGAYLSMLSNTILFNDNTRNRIIADDTGTRLYSAGVTAYYLSITDSSISLRDGARSRFSFDNADSYVISPDGTKYVDVDNTGITLNGFTELGSDSAPAIKMKKLTGIVHETQGNLISIPHGVNSTKILSVDALVQYGGTTNKMAPNWVLTDGYQYQVYVAGANIIVWTVAGSSWHIVGDPVTVLITYEE